MLRCLLVSLVFVGSFVATSAFAQVEPTLLLLDPIGARDPAGIITDLEAIGASRGYRVVRPALGSVVGSLDPSSGGDLVSIAQRSGVHRAVAVWVSATGSELDVHVGLATQDGTAVSLHRGASEEGVHVVAGMLLAEILPAPLVVTQGTWNPVVPPNALEETEASTTHPLRGRNIGLMVAGYVAFGVGWVADLVIGPFGGYQDRTCIDLGSWGGCESLPPGTSFQPAWDDFRAFSLVPVAGPWMQLAAKPPSDDLWPVFLVLDGIVQGAGAILMIVGTALFVDDETADAPSVAVLPTFGPDGAGMRVAGRF